MPHWTILNGLSRRSCLKGLGSLACGSVWPTNTYADQTPPAETNDSELPPVPLATNLLTRLATSVQLDPRRRSLFVLDTGAQATSISDNLARELALRPGPNVMVHGVTASVLVPSALIPRLKLQDEVFENVLAPVFPFELLGAEGLIGLNHLQNFNLLLDIRFQRAALNPVNQRGTTIQVGSAALATRIQRRLSPVPSHRTDGLLLMTIRVGGIETVAFLDTGSQYSVGNLRLLNAIAFPQASLRNATVHGVSGPPMYVRSGPAPAVELGQKRLEQMPLLFGDLHIFDVLSLLDRPALMIGADLLSHFERVNINYRASRVSLGEIMRMRQR